MWLAETKKIEDVGRNWVAAARWAAATQLRQPL